MERSEQKQERIALFPGSFDPFTIGHQSLVKRGLALADRIIIAIGINENKLNRTLTGIETVFLLAEPQYAHISSSAVRELLHFGKDVSAFLP